MTTLNQPSSGLPSEREIEAAARGLKHHERENPYKDEFEEFGAGLPVHETLGIRDLLISQYGYAIPDRAALEEIASHGDIVEIGAGKAYWARCLHSLGVDVVAYDLNPPDETWHPVIQDDASVAGRHPDRSLLISWPDYHHEMASVALRSYTRAGGHTLLYVGYEGIGPTGDPEFHLMLENDERWLLHKVLDIPNWAGARDKLFVYKRKSELG